MRRHYIVPSPSLVHIGPRGAAILAPHIITCKCYPPPLPPPPEHPARLLGLHVSGRPCLVRRSPMARSVITQSVAGEWSLRVFVSHATSGERVSDTEHFRWRRQWSGAYQMPEAAASLNPERSFWTLACLQVPLLPGSRHSAGFLGRCLAELCSLASSPYSLFPALQPE